MLTELAAAKVDSKVETPNGAIPEQPKLASATNQPSFAGLTAWIVFAVAAFHVAYQWPVTGSFALLYLFALLRLAQADTWRKAFYSGLAVGLFIAALRLAFFWRIFSGGAFVLWLVYAFWLGMFVAMARLSRRRFGSRSWLLVPFIWCGLEYFRSELYYLRFAWLSPGFAFGAAPIQGLSHYAGVYGTGFLLMSIASAAMMLFEKARLKSLAVLALTIAAGCAWQWLPSRETGDQTGSVVKVAGIQMEFPTEKEVVSRLNELIRKQPDAELVVLSEYTLSEPVPETLKAWCRKHSRYLLVGGKEPAPAGSFYNTAFVVSPEGNIVFQQTKCVPIQFFKDGLPAPGQAVWDSPWGKLGICICYDLSYARVTDRLVKLGAQALIVPTMDMADWGERQHQLHARVAPVRAAEYGIPLFRVASSGISQLVEATGRVTATAPCPGDGAILSGTLRLGPPGRLPLDRWLTPMATAITGFLGILFTARRKRVTGNNEQS